SSQRSLPHGSAVLAPSVRAGLCGGLPRGNEGRAAGADDRDLDAHGLINFPESAFCESTVHDDCGLAELQTLASGSGAFHPFSESEPVLLFLLVLHAGSALLQIADLDDVGTRRDQDACASHSATRRSAPAAVSSSR